MCLASEGVKVKDPGKTKVELPQGVGGGEVPQEMKIEQLEKTTIKDSCRTKVEQSELGKIQNWDETKPEEAETAKCRDFTSLAMENSPFERNDNIKDHICRSPELSVADMNILGLKPEKIKKKKKKNKLDRHTNEKSTPKKPCKKRQSSESDIESVMYTIEAVAKGDWGAERLMETPRKKPRPVSNVKGSTLDTKSPKKKVKSKDKKTSKEKPMETTKESKPPDFLIIAANKEMPCEASDNIKVEPLTPTEEVVPQSLPGQIKTEDSDCVKKIETCGSRKSERSCKGALYKTLVSEGMLTSLRANVDRGGCLWVFHLQHEPQKPAWSGRKSTSPCLRWSLSSRLRECCLVNWGVGRGRTSWSRAGLKSCHPCSYLVQRRLTSPFLSFVIWSLTSCWLICQPADRCMQDWRCM